VFSFANQAGLDMLETTLIALQEIRIESILDETGRKALCSQFNKIMQQVFTQPCFSLLVLSFFF
jgi:homeobox-leucine zipper protein